MPYEKLRILLQQIEDRRTCVIPNSSSLLVLLSDLVSGNVEINTEYDWIDNKWKPVQSSTSCTPLVQAIRSKHPFITKALVESGADVCKRDSRGSTPLTEAINHNDLETVDYLLQNGAELTIHSAFHPAIQQGHPDIVRRLLDLMVAKGAFEAIARGLMPAVETENLGTVGQLLKVLTDRADSRTINSAIPLVIVTRNNQDMLDLFLEAGADADYRKPSGVTLLEMYILKGDVRMVEALLRAGADVNGATSRSGRSHLALAASLKNLSIVVRLIGAGADVEECLEELEDFADTDVDFGFHWEMLRNDKKLDGPPSRGNYYLFMAIKRADSKTVEALVKNGGVHNINSTNTGGKTPLELSLEKSANFAAIVATLLRASATIRSETGSCLKDFYENVALYNKLSRQLIIDAPLDIALPAEINIKEVADEYPEFREHVEVILRTAPSRMANEEGG